MVSYSVLGWLIQLKLSSFLENFNTRKKKRNGQKKIFEWDLIGMNTICFF